MQAGTTVPTVAVWVQDAYGNHVTGGTGAGDAITLSGTSLACSGGLSAVAAGGTATFSGCTLTSAAGDYALTGGDASDPLVAPATTTVTVTPGSVAQLAFEAVPAATTAGEQWSATVWTEDAFGNQVTGGTGSAGPVTLAGPSLACAGGTSAAAGGGSATFTGCTLTAAGTATVTATGTAPDRTPPPSPATAAVVVAPGPATQVALQPLPSSVVAGTALPAVTVQVQDAYGNVVTTGTGSGDVVAVSGASCTAPALAAAGGVATFTGCTLPTAAGSYAVSATDAARPGLAPAGTTVQVVPGPAASVAFRTPPADVTVGQAFALTVVVEDAYGNQVTSGAGSSDDLSVAGTSLSCAGGTSATAAGGSAELTGCSLGAPPSVTLTAADTSTGGDALVPGTAAVAVQAATTATVVGATQDPGTIGSPVTYAATVTVAAPGGGTPDGTVAFEDAGAPVPGCTAQPLTGGVAQCTVTYEILGSHAVTAAYAGAAGYHASTLTALVEELSAAGLSITEQASASNPDASTVAMSPVVLGGTAGMPTSTGTLNTVQVDDDRGTGSGWTVTAQMQGDFTNRTPAGDPAANVIPASDLLWLPFVEGGSATGVTAGPAAGLSRSVARVLCSAAAGHGTGTSGCAAHLELAVPPGVARGTYTAILDLVVS